MNEKLCWSHLASEYIEKPKNSNKLTEELQTRMNCPSFDWQNIPRQGNKKIFQSEWEQKFINQFEKEENLKAEIDLRKRQNEYYAYRSWACCELECQGYQPLTKKTCAECQKEYEERYGQIQPEDIEPIEKCIICQKTLSLTFFSSEWEVEEKALFVCGEECKDNYWRIKKQILNWVADKELKEQLKLRKTLRKYLKGLKKE